MSSGMLTQEEIDALLKGSFESETPESSASEEEIFSEMEKDAIGEIANISMGTAATTLSMLVGKKVDITTPKVDITTAEQVCKDYPVPSVIVDVRYKSGIEGSNMLILSQRDGAVIVDLMMGGDGSNVSDTLSELQLSGVAEAMNQMMGSAATSMSTMFDSVVDITPPDVTLNDMQVVEDFPYKDEKLVRVSFRMVIEGIIDSILIQVIPINVAKEMVQKLMNKMTGMGPVAETAAAQSVPGPGSMPPPPPSAPPPPSVSQGTDMSYAAAPAQDSSSYSQSFPGSAAQRTYAQPAASVRPVQFAPLEGGQSVSRPDNLDLILDVPLQISVELGRARKTIKEILEMGPGTVIELDRLAGEPVDMIVNGKLIAKCEVVVINETFGIRITDIVNQAERLKTLN